MTLVPVAAAEPYDVVVGAGARETLARYLRGHPNVALVHGEAVTSVADELVGVLAQAGVDSVARSLPDGEGAKDIAVAEELWAWLGEHGLGRDSALVAVGGGSVTDVVGFVAATWLRGVPVVHVPTTLLAMVDAAVGGKTGVNTPAGKNLVGAFHDPRAVVVDTELLATLPRTEFVSGLAEVVKVGFVADPAILGIVEAAPDVVAANADPAATQQLVERAVRVKAGVVGADPREHGRREILNYGHTLGHALEKVAGYGVLNHGSAVAVGMCFAAALAHHAKLLDAETATRHAAVLSALGLPTRYDGTAWPAVRDAMRADKKVRDGRLRFVVLHGLASPGILDDPDEELLAAAWADVAQ
ncbi:MAG: 3-dehydroquinate synthase [Frankia sp.]|nr:3-dehydroquinate synthase [Frankia sp.]